MTGRGAQEVAITVKGGYTPAVIHAKEGTPLRLVFDRQETSSCSEEIVIGDFGIRRFLPAFQKTVVELTPDRRAASTSRAAWACCTARSSSNVECMTRRGERASMTTGYAPNDAGSADERIDIPVSGMTCAACQARVQRTLAQASPACVTRR